MVENILGQGIDIHLLGLRELAKELGEPVPDIFADEAYKILNRFGLSTSQVKLDFIKCRISESHKMKMV